MTKEMDMRPPIINMRLQEADDTTAFLRAARSGNLEKVVEYLDTDLEINTSNSNGLNALHLASKDGHVEIVTELLKRGARVDAATKKGNTALHIASLAGQAEIVNILLQYGSTVNIQSQNGFTPLYMAAQENHDQVVKILLCSGANQSLATEDGFTPLAVAMQQGHDKVVSVLLENDSKGKVRLPALHIAAKKDDCKAADLLLQNDHKPDVTSKSGFTPLHIAAHYGNEEIARLLIKRGADVNYLAKHNISPLHVAAKWGKNNMVKILLENSATIDSKTRDGLTPLHCAARSGHDQVVAALLENSAPISARTKNGLAPLHMASQGDHVDAARVLLYHRAPVDEVTIDYLTSLHVAAHCGHVRVAKLLLDRKADPNARALNGFTPLHIACKKNRIKVVELLIKHGASIESTTESGLTPLHVASFMGCMNIVIFLLQHEANPDVPTVRGETPLHLAARANQTDIIRILLRNGAKVDARAREQQTPLHVASRLGNVDIVMLLLQHGAAVDTTTKDMYTALHIAAKEGQEEVAAILVENGASLKAATKNGFTPLHIAAKYGNMMVAKILLQKDNALDAGGKNEITALHMACHYDHPTVASLLLERGASPCVTSQNGHTPLHVAARKNQMEIASALLEHGANANAESKAGFTPLHLSAQKGHHDMTNLLVEHGADPNHKAKNGLTALHLCAQEDFVRVASILVKNGANVESRTESGYRPIHVAAHFGNPSMVRFLLKHNAEVDVKTNQDYTPLHQAAQQGHAHVASALLDGNASHRARTNDGLTALNIAQKLGYISVMEVLKGLSYDNLAPCNKNWEEKYKVVAPESLQEASFMSDSDDEGGSDTLISEQPYRYLTADLMKSLRDDSLPIDVTRDDPIHRQVSKEDRQEFVQSNNYCSAENFEMQDNATLGFLVSFLVDARGGTMRGCRHSGIRIVIPPRRATMPLRVTCRLVKASKTSNPPPLMEGEALATRIVEMGPVGATFLGPVLIDVPHFASARGKEREIIILRSENGETWKEHDNTSDNDDTLAGTPHDTQMSASYSGRITRIITTDFPQYFAIITRIKQEVHVIGSEGGILISSVVNHVQAVFPPGALTKKIKVGLQAHVIPYELTAKLLGNCVAVSPVITIEPRRRKFHKPITLTIPVPQAANKGMINQYGGETPTLRLLCSIAGGTSEAQWEDVTGSTPLTFMNDRVSFTTTVSARFWLMDCRNIGEVPKMATELYKESLFVPFVTNFVIYSKRMDLLEATLRILCMTDGKEGLHTLERQEEFVEIVKSRDVEALDSKDLYIEFSGNLIPVTKSGVQLKFTFKAFRQNRLSFHAKVKDPLLDPVARMLFMREPKVAKGEPSQQPICILNIVLPELLCKDKFQVKLDNESDFEDSNIISQKIDSYASEYEAEGREKSDDPKAVVASPLTDRKFLADANQKDRGDAAIIHESLAQKAACPLETVDASYPNKIDACKRDVDDGSPDVVEKKTYSEKRKFWEEIGKKRDVNSMDQYESEISQTSFQSTANDTDGECTKSSPASEADEEEVADKRDDEHADEKVEEEGEGEGEGIDIAVDINVPDISECSVAEKAHYFEEQIQKELMTPAKAGANSKIPSDSEPLKYDRGKGREKIIGKVSTGSQKYDKIVDKTLNETENVTTAASNDVRSTEYCKTEENNKSKIEVLQGAPNAGQADPEWSTAGTETRDQRVRSDEISETSGKYVDLKLSRDLPRKQVERDSASKVVAEELSSIVPEDACSVPATAPSPASVIEICKDMLQEERKQTSAHVQEDKVDLTKTGRAGEKLVTATLRGSLDGSGLVAESVLTDDNLGSAVHCRGTIAATLQSNILLDDTETATGEAAQADENLKHVKDEFGPRVSSDTKMEHPATEDEKFIRYEEEQPKIERESKLVANDQRVEEIRILAGENIPQPRLTTEDNGSRSIGKEFQSESESVTKSLIRDTTGRSEGSTSQFEMEACRQFLDNEIASEMMPTLPNEQMNRVKAHKTTKEFESHIPKHVGAAKVEREAARATKPKVVTASKIPVTTDPRIPPVHQPWVEEGTKRTSGDVTETKCKGKESESRIPKRIADVPKPEKDDSTKHKHEPGYQSQAQIVEELKETFVTSTPGVNVDGESLPRTGRALAKDILDSGKEPRDFNESLRTEKKTSLSIRESREETSKIGVMASSKKLGGDSFGIDRTEAFDLFEKLSESDGTGFTTVKSTVDRRVTASTKEKEVVSSEITTAAGKTVVAVAEREHSEEKESERTEATLVQESPTQRIEETERNRKDLEIKLERETSVKLVDDCRAFVAEGSASETVLDSEERDTFKSLENEQGLITNATKVSSLEGTVASASVEIRADLPATQEERRPGPTVATSTPGGSRVEDEMASSSDKEMGSAPREGLGIIKTDLGVDETLAKPRVYGTEEVTVVNERSTEEDDDKTTKESEARSIAETIIRSIETEIENRSIDAENTLIRDPSAWGRKSEEEDEDNLSRTRLIEPIAGRTFDKESKQDSISITEDLTKDEESSSRSRDRNGSLPFETSSTRMLHERDMTVSPSTASDHTEMEDSMEVDSNELGDARRPVMTADQFEEEERQLSEKIVDQEGTQSAMFSRKESFDELAARDTATLRTSGARVLEIIEPEHMEIDVMEESIKWKTENESSRQRPVTSQRTATNYETAGISTSSIKLYPERDITISPSTVSERTDSIDEPILNEQVRNDYDMVLQRKINSLDADSPPLISPKMRIQTLDIKPVNWMIGDEKIEISEPLQPSQVFSQELEEYESVVKQLSMEEAVKDDETTPTRQVDDSRQLLHENVSADSEIVTRAIPKEPPKTKFIVIPVSDKQLESELVENNLDISCQELMDTLQKEFDAKTPTDNFVSETSGSDSWIEKEMRVDPAKTGMQDPTIKGRVSEKSEYIITVGTDPGATGKDHLEEKACQPPVKLDEERDAEEFKMKEELGGIDVDNTVVGLSKGKESYVAKDIVEKTDEISLRERPSAIEKHSESVKHGHSSNNEISGTIRDVSGDSAFVKEDDTTSERQQRIERAKSHHDTGAVAGAGAKVKKEADGTSLDLSARYAITVLDQVVKKEIAEVKESLEAAKQDLIEELSENCETVFQIKDSPSEFQFKLQPESIPNELPFLYKAMPAEEQVKKHDVEPDVETASPVAKPRISRDDSKLENDENLGFEGGRIGRTEDDNGRAGGEPRLELELELGTGTRQAETWERATIAIPMVRGAPSANVGDNSDYPTADEQIPVPASRSSSDAETKDDGFLMCPPQPAPRRRHKPARAAKKIKSDSETDIGSSSGESNYQPCDYEIGSGSRPSSSDIEAMQSGLPSGTASEYETALMSMENSSASRPTSQDYHTAISSLSSRESIKSLNSESSGHLASIESSSELSETLVPSEGEVERDNLDENVDHVLEEDMIAADAPGVSRISYSPNSDNIPPLKLPGENDTDLIGSNLNAALPCRMKRSSEMIFQQNDESCRDLDAAEIAADDLDPCQNAEVVTVGQEAATGYEDIRENKFIDNATSTTLADGDNLTAHSHLQSVDLTTSRVDEDGVQSVCTQVTSRDQSAAGDGKMSQVGESTLDVVEARAIADSFHTSVAESKLETGPDIELPVVADAEAKAEAKVEVEVELKERVSAVDGGNEPAESAQRPDLTLIQQTSMSTSSTSGMSLETVVDNKEKQDRRSPDSDSFELVDKPDIIDDFVVIEEVGREAEEFDSEGKSIHISSSSIVCASVKNYDREVENLIADNKDDGRVQSTSQSSRNNELFDFESEESPPQVSNEEQLYSQSYSDDEQYEGGKKWVEMQFQTDARGYEIDYDRGPLEDIKEEEITDFEAGSSRFGSLGSHKESVGSIGSTRGSLGSTPEYDVLAGRKYFTKPSEHDNLSLSSLQEFENLETAMAMENSKKVHCGSQDSINNGSLPRRYLASRSGHGDDVSLSSLKDFEGLETACREAHMIELRAREEEDLLDHESPENRYKLESLARAKAESSAPASFNPSTSGSDDYEKRIREIDEIIRIAQSNVEKFDRQDDTADDISQIEITEADCKGSSGGGGGRGSGPSQEQGQGQGKGGEATAGTTAGNEVHPHAMPIRAKDRNVMETSTDSLELDEPDVDKRCDPLCRSSDSLEMKTILDLPSLSSDSLNNARDSREPRPDILDQIDNSCRRLSSDSLEIPFSEQRESNMIPDKSYDDSCSNRNYTERSDTDNSSIRRISTNEAASLTNISLKNTSSNNGT